MNHASNASDSDRENNFSSYHRKHENLDGENSGPGRASNLSPFGHQQNLSSHDNIMPNIRQKTIKKKKTKVIKKSNIPAMDGEYDQDINYQIKL